MLRASIAQPQGRSRHLNPDLGGASLSLLDLHWNPLILAEVGSGVGRFSQIQRNLGISSRVLSERLKLLVEHGILERHASGKSVEYLPTDAGRELMRVWLRRVGGVDGDLSNGRQANGTGVHGANGHPEGLERPGRVGGHALALFGERWTLVILAQVFAGAHRFSEIRDGIGISGPVLSRRLRSLVDNGVLERRPYWPSRYEYWPSAKGRELYPALSALADWGSRS
jgi:DNA-binding HxlR family transcriptional regulator